MASCPPPFPPWSTRSGSNPGVVRVSQRSAAPGKEGGKTALSRSLKLRLTTVANGTRTSLHLKAAFLFQLVLTAQTCMSTDPSRQCSYRGSAPCAPTLHPKLLWAEENVASWSVDQNCGCAGPVYKGGATGKHPTQGLTPLTPASRRPPALGAQPSPAPAQRGQASSSQMAGHTLLPHPAMGN